MFLFQSYNNDDKSEKDSTTQDAPLLGGDGEEGKKQITTKKANYNATSDEDTGLMTDSSTTSKVSSLKSDNNAIETNGGEYAAQARRLSIDLVNCNNDEKMEKEILMRSLDLDSDQSLSENSSEEDIGLSFSSIKKKVKRKVKRQTKLMNKSTQETLVALMSIASIGLVAICALFLVGNLLVGPPRQPVGPYKLVDLQEGDDFFSHYIFYNGQDSEGSKGYINYVAREEAFRLGIANVTLETNNNNNNTEEPFVYMSTSPTEEGPRDSVRLEGLKRYNRGLFIIDIRHMPAGCGTWPAFWLTDEANWPINGEIDLIEGVNTQTEAKTALHTTKVCNMNDVPQGVKTGSWDTAQGVPMKNGELDMTLREAKNCFVYDPHQWLNQGCVAVSDNNATIGTPLNDNGGGVFVLEWDPINRFMKSWAFTPHGEMPENLRQALDYANNLETSKQVVPDPTLWSLPYAYFPIGKGTNCPSEHFRNMHLVFNMALCGSVSGNRFFMDCPILNEKYGSCDDYIKANTDAMNEIYWKVRGVYVYEREWERSWA
jgi:hypothetical protein